MSYVPRVKHPLYVIDIAEDGTAFIMQWVQTYGDFHSHFDIIAKDIPLEKVHYFIKQMKENNFELDGYKKAIGEN